MDDSAHLQPDIRSNSNVSRRRFVAGAIAVGLPIYLTFSLVVVALDTQVGGAGHALFHDGSNLVYQVAIVIPAVVALAVGWRGRGSAISGAAVGTTAGGIVASLTSDLLTRATDPNAATLSSLDMAGIGIFLLWIAAMLAVFVAGAIGWGMGLAIGRRP